jgi:DNA-binding helix-hairpin-helix protein with protein kinase domain
MIVYAHKKDGTSMPFILNEKGISGGEGTVYKIGAISGLEGVFCAKIYHAKYRTIERKNKIAFMIKHRPEHLKKDDMVLICYPVFLLYDTPVNGNFIGFVMYYAFENSSTVEELSMNVTVNSFNKRFAKGKLNYTDKEIFQKFPRCQRPSEISKLLNRFKVINNIASIFNYLHSTQKYVVGDIKPVNLLMTVKASISLVDIDSIQISENGILLFPNSAGTPEYCPPEFQYIFLPSTNKQAVLRPVSFDLFSMAVLFYEILIGTHPFNCKPIGSKDYDVPLLIQKGYFCHGRYKSQVKFNPLHSLFDYLPNSIKTLFIRAFEGSPNNRPQAIEWQKEVKKIIESLDNGSTTRRTTPVVKQPTPRLAPQQQRFTSKYCDQCGKPYYNAIAMYCSGCGKERTK